MTSLKERALHYHESGRPGKIATEITKPANTADDLTLAYSPGVGEPVKAIADYPKDAYRYTNKGNLVAVITDGTAVLGLGNVGPLAGKPVMEGKAVLFKRFADVDVFDIEVNANNPDEFVQTVKNIAPTFGGINLEDIKAPECFFIEQALIEALDIPVFHDDQHGTAIIVAAGLLNALEIQGKSLDTAKIVCLGAGAAGIASMNLLLELGTPKENIYLVDSQGVLHNERENHNPYKAPFTQNTKARSLDDALEGADVLIGLAGPNLVSEQALLSMAENPIVFALSNPDPEINPALAHSLRDDLLMATGRSDYPNQVNNVLCFPYIFRAALDTGAKKITTAMKLAAVHAIKDLAREPLTQDVLDAYEMEQGLGFGKDYIIPKPLDARLSQHVTEAIKAAT